MMNRDSDGHWAWAVVNAGFALEMGSGRIRACEEGWESLKSVNGNSKQTTKLQHGYVITNRETRRIVKAGVSGEKLIKNGTSRRANSQVK